MNGVEVKVPERALRPREPAPPLPSVTMRSPMVARRMLRPRTKAETALVGVDVKAALDCIRQLKKQQRACEAQLQKLVDRLKSTQSTLPPASLKTLQSKIDKLLKQIELLAAKANEAAMAAIKGGASQEQVRAAAGEGSVLSRVVPGMSPAAPAPGSSDASVAAPVVVETNTPAVLTDGTVVPGTDAKLTTPDGKPVEPPAAGADADEKGGISLIHVAIAGGLAWWLWRRSKRG
jgi:hypothetical protein